MPRFKRTDRINEQLKQEIAVMVHDEVRDPRVGLATVTAVETSPELDHAKVYVTTLGDEKEQADVLVGLRSAAPFIRSQLGKRLHMRRIPELHFEYDRVLAGALHIERLLREALPNGPEVGTALEETTDSADSADAAKPMEASAETAGDSTPSAEGDRSADVDSSADTDAEGGGEGKA
ncbi:MAG: ribosome-binding factor [Gemmatimonadetes bacterium]|nr:ribosome-binding factor [Gemmatimonadota bacterium]